MVYLEVACAKSIHVIDCNRFFFANVHPKMLNTTSQNPEKPWCGIEYLSCLCYVCHTELGIVC